MRRIVAPIILATGALAIVPAGASAASCPLSGPADASFDNTALDVEGNIDADRAGGYLQIPFQVPAGSTAIRVQYSYDQPGGLCSLPSGNRNTLDVGVYDPRASGEDEFTAADSRGWSGSSVRDLAIARNGFTDDATYDADRKAFVHGYTTRAYRPGAIPAGEWAVELGLGFIDSADPDGGIDYRVRVQTTDSSDWTGQPWNPVPNDPGTVRTGAGWYSGDLHAHGEMEPGNATMTQTFDSAFSPMSGGGAGLDFLTVVDHNNDVAHRDLGTYQAQNPDHLIVPGTEVTTYRGHYNNQGSGPFVDFRAGPVYAGEPASPVGSTLDDSDLATVRGMTPPREQFARIDSAGGWTQINHPTIFRNQPDQCRGCAWGYSEAETDYDSVDAVEVQTGPAGIPANSPTIFNPFTRDAFAFYEAALDGGAHLAAVGSSDDHQGGGGSGITYSPVGSAATVVYAEELSEQAIVDAVRGDHTYVKLFGPTGPDIELTAAVPGRPEAIIGDSASGPSASFVATVEGAADAGRPGEWSLVVLKNGNEVERVPFAGNSFTHEFDATATGRYSIAVERQQGTTDATNMVENYSSPIWFTRKAVADRPSNRFRLIDKRRNKRRGTAKMIVRVPGPGSMKLAGKSLAEVSRRATGANSSKLRLKVKPRGRLRNKLERRGRATARPKLTYEPAGGTERTKGKRVVLRLR